MTRNSVQRNFQSQTTSLEDLVFTTAVKNKINQSWVILLLPDALLNEHLPTSPSSGYHQSTFMDVNVSGE